LNRWIGVCFIVIGVIVGTYHYIEWQISRSAAKDLTKLEIKQYKQEEKQAHKVFHESSFQRQIPTSTMQYEPGEKVALLIIPKISQKYSVYWGTDKKILKKGVGMFVSQLTTVPNGGGHTVLSGHRDTVFVRLGELKESDILKIEYSGSIYTYKVTKIWITDAKDQSVIVEKAAPTLTLTTCYPFNYIGDAPKRYIVQAGFLYKQDVRPVLQNNGM